MKEKSILIVDDSEEFREVASEAIHQQGYRVIEADDGYGGLASMATGEVPDLIITDVHMPTLDGIQFLKALRKNPRFAAVPVIICSADQMFNDLPIGLGDVRCTGKDIQIILQLISATNWQSHK